ncbi:UNVERIFIED_CONTAM: hypothetical protein Slati_3420000 [Sesamum latifolium]|uniref:Uncharacterized protein n=1 Tax=Sesamum latifolium TaxID=2727402 RepID=A0AAW2UER7_9LAMI
MPHIVSVGSPTSNSSRFTLASKGLPGGIPGQNEGFGIQHLSFRKFTPANFLNAVKLRRDGPLCLMTEHKEAVWTNYAAVTKPDTSILNRLIDAGLSPRVEESMSVVNNDILRRHFLELTTNFLAPFGPYFRANTPSEASSPFADPPPLPSFNAEEFLTSLSARGPGKFLQKRMRSNWLDLYRRFLNGHNFLPWFQRKRAVAEQEQYKLWRQARVKTNINQLIRTMSELEIVDSFNAIERHLQGEMQYGIANEGTEAVCEKLKKDLKTVFSVLPKDMQQLLIMNPERASLLQENHECSDLPKHTLLPDGVELLDAPFGQKYLKLVWMRLRQETSRNTVGLQTFGKRAGFNRLQNDIGRMIQVQQVMHMITSISIAASVHPEPGSNSP